MANLTVRREVRVSIDPNVVAPGNPTWTVAMLTNADRAPLVNERVIVVQDDSVGPNLIGWGVARGVDEAEQLLFIEVDWASFIEEPFAEVVGQEN